MTTAINPFIGELTVETKNRKDLVERSILTDKAGNEIGAELNKLEYVDRAEFVKVFAKWLPMFFDLNAAGFKVWVLIALSLKVGQAEVYLHQATASQTSVADLKGQPCMLTKQTFYRGLANLIALKFIAKKPGVGSGWYYINPSAFFCGDRVKFARTYAVKGLPGPRPKIKVFNAISQKRETL